MLGEGNVYNEFGIRTRQGAYWLMFVLVGLALNVVVFYGVRTHDIRRAALAGFWVLAVAVSTVSALRKLAALETQSNNEAARLAFRLALVQPILGTIPVILAMLP